MPKLTPTFMSPKMNPTAFSDVVGMANDTGRIGAVGSNPSNHSFGFLAGNDPVFFQHAGVYGESDQQGVIGLATTNAGTGVYGGGSKRDGDPGSGCIGVRGETFSGVGVQGQSFGVGLAGRFFGNVEIAGLLTIDGIVLNLQMNELNTRADTLQREIDTLQQEVQLLSEAVAQQQQQQPKMPVQPPTPPRPSSPSINITSSGSGATATFTMTGSGFTPSANVRVRIVDDSLAEVNLTTSSDVLGSLNFRFSLPCSSRVNLHFSATDGRADQNDLTGALWSNTVTLPCP